MTITQIENNLNNLIENFKKENFIFDLLLAFGEPQATITRLQKGELNQLESKGELHHRKKLFFKVVNDDLHLVIDKLRKDIEKDKQKPRFIIVTDYDTFLAYDTKTTDTLDINIQDIAKHYDFFLPLAGMEKAKHIDENPADVKASNKLAKLYDEILKTNPTKTHEEVHALNVFLTRLLFCYFAEDSKIFEDNVFTNSISNHTQVDGSDVDSYLDRLFGVFNTPDDRRDSSLPKYLKSFPYVNGGLFRDKQPLPKFTTKSRNILLEIGTLDWSEINPDIFGSMIQAVVKDEYRGEMGMHYTSVPNIMKVMQPLFLDELYEEFEKAKGNAKKLNLLHLRLQNLKIFDPACGSGNFLIIAYKELRKLEMLIFKEGGLLISPSIKLTQFYGIELDDFAHEVAILSLWLAEHQMNVLFKKEFGTVPPALPLQHGGNVFQGNATRLNWEDICPKNDADEIYILGNPPYKGFSQQEASQKEDIKNILGNSSKLDYVSCWFIKGAIYINNFNASFAFVSTNSISQGEQVDLLWPIILFENLEISFAYQSFKWTNNAKGNAGVTVVIVGLRNKCVKNKFIFVNSVKTVVNNINPYLTQSKVFTIAKRNKVLSKLPSMVLGNMPNDWGYLHFTTDEKNKIVNEYPESEKYFKKVLGSQEFIKGIDRWCLWINDNQIEEISIIEPIVSRLKLVAIEREKSKKTSYNKFANKPHRFIEIRHQESNAIIIPGTSSENRKYVPIGFVDSNVIINNLAFAIYKPEPYHFGILTSYMHNLWVKSVGGSLETRIRYSSVLCYNTFPFPDITEMQKEKIAELVFNILDEREKHSEKTIAQMYDPNKMPKGLKEAHHQLDLAIEKCYRNKPFENDEERLEYLFKLYEEMTQKEKQ